MRLLHVGIKREARGPGWSSSLLVYVPPSTQFCTAEIAKYIRAYTSFRGFLITFGPPSGVDLARNNLTVIITLPERCWCRRFDESVASKPISRTMYWKCRIFMKQFNAMYNFFDSKIRKYILGEYFNFALLRFPPNNLFVRLSHFLTFASFTWHSFGPGGLPIYLDRMRGFFSVLEQTSGYRSAHTYMQIVHSMHSKIDPRDARECASEPWTRGVNWFAYVLQAIRMEFPMYYEAPHILISLPVISRCTYAILQIIPSISYLYTRASAMKKQIFCSCYFFNLCQSSFSFFNS